KFMFKPNVLLTEVLSTCRRPMQVRLAKRIQYYIQDRNNLDAPYYDANNMFHPEAWVTNGKCNEDPNEISMHELSDHDKDDVHFFLAVSAHLPEDRKDISAMQPHVKQY